MFGSFKEFLCPLLNKRKYNVALFCAKKVFLFFVSIYFIIKVSGLRSTSDVQVQMSGLS